MKAQLTARTLALLDRLRARLKSAEPRPMVLPDDAPAMKNFEEAFGGGGAGCVRDCDCGRVFYNSDGGWDWEAGELERLRADPNATDLAWSVGFIEFEGRVFVWDCRCWRPRASKIIAFLQGHDNEIAKFLTLEKRRKQGRADRSPEVEP